MVRRAPAPSRLLATSAVAALTLSLASTAAFAQSREEQDRRARTQFNAGRDAFTHGDYEEAAQRFEEAYALSRRAQLLYNIGTTYDRLHRWAQARDAFQHYLEAFPNAAEAQEIRGRLTVIDAEIERQRSGRPADVVVLHDATPTVIVRTIPAETHPLRTAGIVLGGLGVLSAAVSITVGALANTQYNNLLNSCGMTPDGCDAASINDIALRATMVNAFYVVAGVLVASGVTMVVVDVTHHRQEAPHARRDAWTAVPGVATLTNAQGAVLTLTGTF